MAANRANSAPTFIAVNQQPSSFIGHNRADSLPGSSMQGSPPPQTPSSVASRVTSKDTPCTYCGKLFTEKGVEIHEKKCPTRFEQEKDAAISAASTTHQAEIARMRNEHVSAIEQWGRAFEIAQNDTKQVSAVKSQLEGELFRLRAEKAKVDALLDKLKAENTRLLQENAQLRQQLAERAGQGLEEQHERESSFSRFEVGLLDHGAGGSSQATMPAHAHENGSPLLRPSSSSGSASDSEDSIGQPPNASGLFVDELQSSQPEEPAAKRARLSIEEGADETNRSGRLYLEAILNGPDHGVGQGE